MGGSGSDNNRELSVNDITPEEQTQPNTIVSIEDELKNVDVIPDEEEEESSFDIMSEDFDDIQDDDLNSDALFDDFE